MDKYLICGLGNPGDEYAGTRHNTGFMVLDAFAKASNIHFEDKRYGFVAETTLKGRKIFLLKPTTFMNLSGNAVRYWLNQEKIDQSRLLVISDELALPLGAFRLKANGSNGGHNGLGHIQQLIGQNYARLRMGIGNDYPRGGQIDWVLGKYTEEDMKQLQPAIDLGVAVVDKLHVSSYLISITIQENARGCRQEACILISPPCRFAWQESTLAYFSPPGRLLGQGQNRRFSSL